MKSKCSDRKKARPWSLHPNPSTAPLRIAALFAVAVALGAVDPAAALTPDFHVPATPTADQTSPLTSYRLPTGPWAEGAVPVTRFEGKMERRAWRLDAPGQSTLELLAPLRAQLEEAGYRVIFECETEGCGGFDFRFATGMFPEPEMHVDLGDFRFLSAEGPDGGAVGLMVSRSSAAGFVQMTEILPVDTSAPAAGGTPDAGATQAAPLSSVEQPPTDPSAIVQALMANGAVTLDGLDFASGSSDLTEGRYSSLAALSDWLKANPKMTVALVGHTDASGSLDANIAVSRRRAQSVRERLIRVYGIPASQVEAQGVGYLAPRDTNLTEAGRTKNRRVEAILTSTG